MIDVLQPLHKTDSTVYRGRFAPSPTGPLHFGSLVTAVGSYLDARSHGGQWLVRIEDLDRPREVPGAACDILATLEKFGMLWDGDVVYQSQRHAWYQTVLQRLETMQLTYACICSRKEIAAAGKMGVSGRVYPGTCRYTSHKRDIQRSAIRVKTEPQHIELTDRVQGLLSQQIDRDIGDFVLQRADGMYAYQLAVVADDAEQQITHIVRGADLLEVTPPQIYLQRLLAYPQPVYMHLPLVTNASGEKLSKQTLAAPVGQFDVLSQLMAALKFLGQRPPEALYKSDLETVWEWAVTNWNSGSVPLSARSVNDFIA